MTKTTIMQASRTFMTRRPCQVRCGSAGIAGATGSAVLAAIVFSASLICSPATLTAVA